jgi:hypothetical protein
MLYDPTGHISKSSSIIQSAWAARADELAAWAWERLVNRTDVWGAYTAPAERGRKYVNGDGMEKEVPASCTAPPIKRRGKDNLTLQTLKRHFRSARPEDVIGLHTTSPDNTSKWGALEIDRHGEAGPGPEATLAAALGYCERLRALGFHPLLTDSNGRGGYHVRVLFAEPVPTAKVFFLFRYVVADFRRRGLATEPETFPKQSAVTERNPCGNWLRVPGRHHTREHWARVWDGARWREGGEAIDQLLAHPADLPDLIPENIEHHWRAACYMATLPNLPEGQGRNKAAYPSLAFVVRDLQLPDHEALAMHLEPWDAFNMPPLGRAELNQILENAHRYGRRPYGSALAPRNGAGPVWGANGDGAGPVAGFHLTDYGNARRLVDRHGQDLRHCHPWKKWLVWDRQRWQLDDTAAVTRRVKETLDFLFGWASARIEEIRRQLQEEGGNEPGE